MFQITVSKIFGMYSATARQAGGIAGPTAAEEKWYSQEFPYYTELAALSEIRKKPGFDVPLRSGIGGHSLLYLNGVRRDRAAGYPVLKLGTADEAVGISVNSHYRNANWVAADGPDFLWRGALSPGESLTRAGYAATQNLAKNLGILDGVEFHEHFFRDKPAGMAARDFMYEISVGTDYAAQFGRDIFRARVPLDKARMAAIVDYLNALNAPYRGGEKKFAWKLFNDNCCHVAHNALAAAGVWPPWPTGQFFARAAFNFPVPKNEFVDLLRRANSFCPPPRVAQPEPPPIAPGAIMIATPAVQENEVYVIDGLKLIFFDNPFWGRYRRQLKRILAEPRYTNLRANLQYFAAALANKSRAKIFDSAHEDFLARESARVAKLLASLERSHGLQVEVTA